MQANLGRIYSAVVFKVFRELVEGLEALFSFEDSRLRFQHLDPRTKIFYVILTIAVLVLISDFTRLTLILALNVSLALFGGLSTRRILKTIRSLGLIAFLIFILNAVITSVLEGFTPETFVDVGLGSLRTFTKLLAAAIPLMVLFSTTTPRNFALGLKSLGVSYKYLYPVIIFARFVPEVFRELLEIYDAQMSRGVDFDRGGVVERLKKVKAVIIPAFVCSMLRARDLMEALELKGFGYAKKVTPYKQPKFKPFDAIFLSVVAIIYTTIVLFVTPDF